MHIWDSSISYGTQVTVKAYWPALVLIAVKKYEQFFFIPNMNQYWKSLLCSVHLQRANMTKYWVLIFFYHQQIDWSTNIYKCVFVNIQNSAYGYYETRQEWDFKYSRYFSGSNISCVATGHQNKTVIKTRQFGVIHCKQLCWYWPLWMYRIKITP